MSDDWKRLVLLPDYQIPMHDPKTVAALTAFVGDYQPDALYHVGDYLDAPEPARWNKGMAGEFAPTLQKGLDSAVEVLRGIREVYDGPFSIKTGNHDERIETYVKKYAPALTPLRGLRIENLLDLDSLDINLMRTMGFIAPGWVLAHGHEGSLNRVAGGTALGLACKIGYSVVCGHTHKVGLKHGGPTGFGGKQTAPLWGLEVGHAMDIKKAGYLKTGSAGWSKGLGLLYVRGRTVIPSAIPIHPDGSFVVDGKLYGK